MKRSVLFYFFVAISLAVHAQSDTSDNYVKKFLSIPAFKVIMVPDSSLFTNEKLKKNTPFMLMFFSPDCDHCQKQIKELLGYKEELKDVQILMLSALPFKYAKDFYDQYGLSIMPNIQLGNDVTPNLNTLFRVRTFPSMYLYDKTGSLLKAFVGNFQVSSILEALK